MIGETHFNKELNRELSENIPEGLKDENLSVFMEFIDAMDMIDIEKMDTALPNDDKFIIKPHSAKIDVIRGTISQPSSVSKTATRIKIKLSPQFSVADIPSLVKDIEKCHNQSEETLESGAVLDATRFLSESYLYWAKQLDTITDRVPEAIRPRFREYIDKLVELSAIYDEENAGNKQLKDLTGIDFPNISAWTKSIEGKRAINRWNDFIEGPMNEYENQPKRLEHMMDLIDTLVVVPNIKESLDYNLAQTIFLRGEKEMWQLSDVPEIFKAEFKPETVKEYFESTFSKEWNALDNLRNKLAEAKVRGDIRQISRLQEEIADRVMVVVDSKKFWAYSSGNYSTSDIARKREINCMARTTIIHNVFKEFFNEETLDGAFAGHDFPVLKLADGSFYVMERFVNPRIFKGEPDVELQHIKMATSGRRYPNRSWIYICEQQKGYQAGVWNFLMRPNNYRFAFEQARKLTPDWPTLYTMLAELTDEADDYNGKADDIERALLKSVELTADDPFVLTATGNFYNETKYKNDPQKAIIYYQRALRSMDRNPGFENKWSIVQIKAKIKEAKAKLKQK